MADEGAHLKVVPLRDGAPGLNDIPAMRRRLADQVEAGRYGQVTSMLVLMPTVDDDIDIFGWGDSDGWRNPVVLCELAALQLLTNRMERKS